MMVGFVLGIKAVGNWIFC